jgi:hypothetical protein
MSGGTASREGGKNEVSEEQQPPNLGEEKRVEKKRVRPYKQRRLSDGSGAASSPRQEVVRVSNTMPSSSSEDASKDASEDEEEKEQEYVWVRKFGMVPCENQMGEDAPGWMNAQRVSRTEPFPFKTGRPSDVPNFVELPLGKELVQVRNPEMGWELRCVDVYNCRFPFQIPKPQKANTRDVATSTDDNAASTDDDAEPGTPVRGTRQERNLPRVLMVSFGVFSNKLPLTGGKRAVLTGRESVVLPEGECANLPEGSDPRDKRCVLPLSTGVFRFGRDPATCDVTLPCNNGWGLSKEQFLIEVTPFGFAKVTNNSEKIGTFVVKPSREDATKPPQLIHLKGKMSTTVYSGDIVLVPYCTNVSSTDPDTPSAASASAASASAASASAASASAASASAASASAASASAASAPRMKMNPYLGPPIWHEAGWEKKWRAWVLVEPDTKAVKHLYKEGTRKGISVKKRGYYRELLDGVFCALTAHAKEYLTDDPEDPGQFLSLVKILAFRLHHRLRCSILQEKKRPEEAKP